MDGSNLKMNMSSFSIQKSLFSSGIEITSALELNCSKITFLENNIESPNYFNLEVGSSMLLTDIIYAQFSNSIIYLGFSNITSPGIKLLYSQGYNEKLTNVNKIKRNSNIKILDQFSQDIFY